MIKIFLKVFDQKTKMVKNSIKEKINEEDCIIYS